MGRIIKKIGFDIHGVIDENPNLFSKIINKFREIGYEIHILTGSLVTPKLIEELEEYNINYDHLFSILGHHKIKGTEMWKNSRGWWIDDSIWEQTKALYCKTHNLNFHIDDTRSYGKYFNTPFGHLTPHEENPRILEITGDVDTDILDILKENEGYYKMRF